jgi:8-oxo-dGTP diphosphatase
MFPQFEDSRTFSRNAPLNYGELRRLYEHTDWRFLLLDDRLPRRYNNMNTLSLFKAFALPFLVEIPSERAIVRELTERESLRVLCDFKPGEKLPEERTFWHFRKKFADFFSELMSKILISMVLSGKRPNFDLPFVLPISLSVKMPDGEASEIKLDEYRPPIEIWATPTDLKDDDTSVFDQLRTELKSSGDLSQWRKLVTDYEKISKSAKKGLSSNLGLPLEIKITLFNGETIRFAIYQPGWLETSPQHVDTVTTLGPSTLRPYFACNVILTRLKVGEQQILLSKRISGFGTGMYSLPGGKQQEGETLEECAIRELKEETKIALKKSKPVSWHVSRYPGKPQVSSIGVLALDYEGIPYTVEQNQNEKWDWFYINNLPSPLFGPTKIVLGHYLDNKFPNLEWSDIESRVIIAEQPMLFDITK